MRTYTSYESWSMVFAKKGDTMISAKPLNTLTASAAHFRRVISTQRVAVIEGTVQHPVAKPYVKVTFLNDPNKVKA